MGFWHILRKLYCGEELENDYNNVILFTGPFRSTLVLQVTAGGYTYRDNGYRIIVRTDNNIVLTHRQVLVTTSLFT